MGQDFPSDAQPPSVQAAHKGRAARRQTGVYEVARTAVSILYALRGMFVCAATTGRATPSDPMSDDHHLSGNGSVEPDGASVFLIGRDIEGHWLAVDTCGRSGGLFTSEEAARRYATSETGHRFGAVRLTPETMALPL